MLAKSVTAIWALLLLITSAQAQFQFFEQMFGGGSQQGRQQEQEASSDSAWYQKTWDGDMWSKSIRAPALRRATHYSRAFATRYPSTPPQGPRNSIRRPDLPAPIGKPPNSSSEIAHSELMKSADLPAVLRETNPAENTLLSPVHVPEDPNGVLKQNHPAAKLLANSGLVIRRELELLNVLLAYEQPNRYTIYDAQGNHVGHIIEDVGGLGRSITRQWFRTHRSFTAHVFDRDENEILRIHRPFSWVNSRIRIYDPRSPTDQTYSTTSHSYELTSNTQWVPIAEDGSFKISQLPLSAMRVIGEVQQQWALMRRKYDMFLYHPNPTAQTDLGVRQIAEPSDGLSQPQQTQLIKHSGNSNGAGEYHQFSYVDEPALSWDFSLRSADDRLIGSVNRNFSGFAREIFTNMGVYALRMDSAVLAEDKERQNPTSQPSHQLVTQTENNTGMTLDQRAIMLATAISIDFDYFSIHSPQNNAEALPWLWFPGGSSAEGAAAGNAESAAGASAGASTESTALGEVGATAVGRAGAAGTMAEGATAGVAGAGSMAGYDALRRGISPDNQPPPFYEDQPLDSTRPDQSAAPEEVWGETENPWGSKGGDVGPSGSSEGGKSDGIDFDDFDFF
ncbi:hypothetical protein UA08_00317 [Talaromyces atroroseus]|uniref:Phospholipid scramblase n=1 Tax=Talaromyces atroroseus TaxID=1441469 RepID=A0A225B2Z0_TALAT|nr:hypothetical protein UA08_00317 [Talaromyces atroroseus]OKL64088.1 hypothetical protein UA08_00317 [Talaromyces atroroseus]